MKIDLGEEYDDVGNFLRWVRREGVAYVAGYAIAYTVGLVDLTCKRLLDGARAGCARWDEEP